MDNWIESLKEKFGLTGKLIGFAPYGNGHINRTFLLELCPEFETVKYIVQQINDKVFPDVAALMANIAAVIDHLASHTDERHLQYVPTVDGASYWYDSESYFRVYEFLDNCTAFDVVSDERVFAAAAVAFANFQNALCEFDATRLVEVIPDFHNTEKRLADFRTALALDRAGRADTCKDEIEFVLARAAYAGRIVSALRSGSLPTRVTHNDTKINNVLIDNVTGDGTVIDLDTVMPGAVCFDFGDAIRSGASSAAEDERDLTKVHFRQELFSAFAKSFVNTACFLTESELDSLAFGAVLMTYECGMRFLADYLNGDTYFRTACPDHNLVRARTQFKLVSDMEGCLDDMEGIVKSANNRK